MRQILMSGMTMLMFGCSAELVPEVAIPNREAPETSAPPMKRSCETDSWQMVSASGPTPLTSRSFRSQPVVGGTRSNPGVLELSPEQERALGALVQDRGSWVPFCSGTLISERHVLTAAHCVIDLVRWNGSPDGIKAATISPSLVFFGLGATMQAPDDVIPVDRVSVHPSLALVHADPRYFPSAFGLKHDLAILSLSRASSTAVSPIPPSAKEVELVGSPVLLGGFGDTGLGTRNVERFFAVAELSSLSESYYSVRYLGQGRSASGDSGGGMIAGSGETARVIGTVLGPLYPEDGGFGPSSVGHLAWIEEVTATGCGGLDERGRCESDGRAVYCKDGQLHHDDCDEAQSCQRDACGRHRCEKNSEIIDPVCNTLDYFGQCKEEVLQWCLEGRLLERSCEAEGMLCRDSGDSKRGFDCMTSDEDEEELAETKLLPCKGLESCFADCVSDMWCGIQCIDRGSTEALRLWSERQLCYDCAQSDPGTWYCRNETSRGVCQADCSAPRTEDCTTCLTRECENKISLCTEHTNQET